MAVDESPGEQKIQSVLLEQAQFNSEPKNSSVSLFEEHFMPSPGFAYSTRCNSYL